MQAYCVCKWSDCKKVVTPNNQKYYSKKSKGENMDRKESRNGLELIKYGAIRLRGNFSALFMGALAMVTPLTLVFLIPYLIARFTDTLWVMSIGIALFAILVGPLQIGYIRYFNETIDGNQPRLSRVYSCLNFSIFTLRTIYIALILMVIYIVGGILWMIPGCFAVSFYSMTLFFLEKYKYPRLSEAMNDCSKQMIGNRLAMFSYKLIFYLVYLLLFGMGALCLGLVFILAEDSLLVSYVVALCSTIVFIFMYTMVTVYYHSCNQIFFEDTLMYNERKRARLQREKELRKQKSDAEKQNATDKNSDTKAVAGVDEKESKEKVEKAVIEVKAKTKKSLDAKKVKSDKKSSKKTENKSKKDTKSEKKDTKTEDSKQN